MKVLIAGGYGLFTSRLIERLARESFDVFVICGKHANKKLAPRSKYNEYKFDLTDERIKVVIDSISPDCVIFLGAYDDNYLWADKQRGGIEYLGSLTNILAICEQQKIGSFIYISSEQVYGTNYNESITEKFETRPNTYKGIIINEGEKLAKSICENNNIELSVLRISSLYGEQLSALEKPNYAISIYRNILQGNSIHINANKRFSPTYVLDAVDAVYRILIAGKNAVGIYNIAGEECSEAKFVQVLIDTAQKYETPVVLNESGEKIYSCLKAEAFEESFSFAPIYDIEKGFERVIELSGKNVKELKITKETRKKVKKSDALKSSWSDFVRSGMQYIENLLIFVIVAFLTFILKDFPVFKEIDFMLLYILAIALTMGLRQGIIAVVLSCGFSVYFSLTYHLLQTDIYYSLIIRIMTLFAVGMLAGYCKEAFTQAISAKEDEIESMSAEFMDIYEINQSNTKIKKVLEDRLVNYGDSMAKIYTVISKLNYLEPEKITFAAVEVISSIIQSKHVSIYMLGNDKGIMRLAASSHGDSLSENKTLFLSKMPELAEAIERNEVFVNKTLMEGMPVMAAPIFSAQNLVALVTINKIDFEKTTPYHVNLLSVLCKMISTSIERAYTHESDLRDKRYIKGTNILNHEAFLQVMKMFFDAQRDRKTQYCLIEILENTKNIEMLDEKLSFNLRVNDYVGLMNNGKMFILLSNTSKEESRAAIERLKRNGINSMEVSDLSAV